MKCGKCGHDNPDKAKFCMDCGNTMERSCANCSEELADGAKFCMNCGHKVLAADAPPPAPAKDRLEQYIPRALLEKLQTAQQGAAMRGERRVVTILFCDVKGSTAAAEQLDPEEWAEIMNGAFEHLIAPVYRYEGTLARLMGDAILAFFGAPIAHEDDPERATLAALAIVQEIGPYAREVKRKWNVDIDVRVGINTGLVVVGEVGTDMRLEYTAMGDAVNLASRMESTAEPGTVQISSETQAKVAPLFELEPLGAIEVKGKTDPVETFRVLRPKDKPERLRGIEGLDSPMVGRDAELAALRGKADAIRRGAGSVVSIMAEAGLGKSRLAAELKKQLADEGVLDEVSWFEGRALSYQTTTPYAPVADFLTQMFPEVPDEGDANSRYGVLFQHVQAVTGDRASEVAPFLASRLGLALPEEPAERVRYLDPPDLRRQVDAAVVEYIEALTEKRPMVLVLEDLHWADSSTLELMPELMKLTERAPLMLVGILRPRPQDQSWKFHEVGAREFAHRYLNLTLSPLDDGDARRLVANLLLIEGLPESLRTLILMKAEGNPFFVEEVVRSLIDSGAVIKDGELWKATRDVENIKVPDSLSALLTTRLDSLGDNSKALAQTAAVIGRQFDFDILASVHEPLSAVEEALSDLQRRGIMREKSRRPHRLYSFKHVLTQEAAYESLLLKSRRELHRKVADALSRIAPEQHADIARHFLEAREPDLALPHLVDAAEAAARAYSTPEALGQFDRALTIIKGAENPDLALARRIYEGRGTALQLIMDVPGALANYEEMKAFFDAQRDDNAVVSALNKTAFITTMFMGDVDAGNAILDQAQSLAEQINCNAGQAESCMIRCAVYTSKAEFDMAHRYLDQAIQLGETMEAEEPMLYGKTHIANTMVYMTEFERAGPKIREALEAAEKYGNKKYQAELKTFPLPTFQMNEGDGAAAVQTFQEGIAMAEQIGAMMSVSIGTAMLGKVMESMGQFDAAISLNRRAVEASRMTGVPFIQSVALCNLGTSYLQISEQLHPKALEVHEEALRVMEMPLGKVMAAMTYCELGSCALEIGKPERAMELFEMGLATKSAPINICKPKLHLGIASTALVLGDIHKALENARAARAFCEEKGIHMYDPFLLAADAAVAAGEGRRDEAIERHLATAEMAGQAGLRPLAWQSLFAASKLLRDAGKDADADARKREAAETIDALVEAISDPGLRELYGKHARSRLQA